MSVILPTAPNPAHLARYHAQEPVSRPSDNIAPRRRAGADTIEMISQLARDAPWSKDALEALTDMACTSKMPGSAMSEDEHATLQRHALHAESCILALFADPTLASSSQEAIVAYLLSVHKMLSDTDLHTADSCFGMPASLLHLVGQYGAMEQTKNVAYPIVERAMTQEISQSLARREGTEQTADTITQPHRFSGDEEVQANFSRAVFGYPHVLNLDDGIGDGLIEKLRTDFSGMKELVDRQGLAIAPLFMNNHFMLMTMQPGTGGKDYEITIANTNGSPDDQKPDTLLALIIDKLPVDRKSVKRSIIQDYLQGNVPNSCGALVCGLAHEISAHRPSTSSQTIRFIAGRVNAWRSSSAVQQEAIIMAQRSRMTGDRHEDRNESRFVTYHHSGFGGLPSSETRVTHL